MKKLYILLIAVAATTLLHAQNGAKTTQELGKALLASMQNGKPEDAAKYFVGEAELKVVKGAKEDKDEAALIGFLVPKTIKDLSNAWTATKDKLEKDGVNWQDIATPAVSHEPFQGKDGGEQAILQVMFKSTGKMHTLSVVIVQVNSLWYILDDIQPNAHPAYDK